MFSKTRKIGLIFEESSTAIINVNINIQAGGWNELQGGTNISTAIEIVKC